jgi:hypothetical protein
LIVKWPERLGGFDNKQVIAGPTTLKIPREYMYTSPGRKDKQGGIEQLTITFGIPDGRPLKYMNIPLRNAPQAELDAYDVYEKEGVMVLINRNGRPTKFDGEFLMKRGSTRVRDGMYAGLERYSSYQCLEERHPHNPPTDPAYIKWINERTAGDPSPRNCRVDRQLADYITVPETTSADDSVLMFCHHTRCNVSFYAGGHPATLWLKPQSLEHWRDYVEPARKLINSFVVIDAVPAS